jgi:hypothetical protein
LYKLTIHSSSTIAAQHHAADAAFRGGSPRATLHCRYLEDADSERAYLLAHHHFELFETLHQVLRASLFVRELEAREPVGIVLVGGATVDRADELQDRGMSTRHQGVLGVARAGTRRAPLIWHRRRLQVAAATRPHSQLMRTSSAKTAISSSPHASNTVPPSSTGSSLRTRSTASPTSTRPNHDIPGWSASCSSPPNSWHDAAYHKFLGDAAFQLDDDEVAGPARLRQLHTICIMPFRVMGRLGLDSVGISRTTGAPHWRMCLHCDGSSAMQHSHWWQGFGRNRSRPSTPMSVNWK